MRKQAQISHYTSYVQVIAPEVEHTAPSVLLVFDKERYLFNAGEGLQRTFNQHKLRPSKLTDFLFTRVSTEVLGGLPGILLSAHPNADSPSFSLTGNGPVATVQGPDGITTYVDAIRKYTGLGIKVVTLAAAGGAAAAAAAAAAGAAAAPPPPPPAISSPVVTITPVRIQAAAAAAQPSAAVDDSDAVPQHDSKRQKVDADSTPAVTGRGDGGSGNDALPQRAAQASPSSSGSSVRPVPDALCYVCELADRAGKFDPKKATALGVPMGPLFGKLTRGQSVTANNGTTVHPADVMDPPTVPGPVLVVIDCPSPGHLDGLKAAPRFREWTMEAATAAPEQPSAAADAAASADASASGGGGATSGSPKPVVFVHIGPRRVVGSAAYRSWVASFSPHVAHVAASSGSHQPSPLRKAVLLQSKLNLLHPGLFPLLTPTGPAPRSGAAAGGVSIPSASGGDSAGGEAASVAVGMVDGEVPTLSKLHLMPARPERIDSSDAPLPAEVDATRQALAASHPELLQLAADIGAAAASTPAADEPPRPQLASREELEITWLGTVSAAPSTYRNVSATLLDFPGRGTVLMDCGEDTIAQLVRRFGERGCREKLDQLRAVFVSHMHADHHGGLYRLLEMRGAGGFTVTATSATAAAADAPASPKPPPPPLLIIGPFPLYRVLQAYGTVLPGMRFTFLPHAYFTDPALPRPPPPNVLAEYERVRAALRLAELRSFDVEHIRYSCGLLLRGAVGWKVVFTGDTRPCRGVVDAAAGADLLVHEATFEDELREEAVARKHSTTGEALEVAAQAGAYRTVLTHFSTRYPTVPAINTTLKGRVAIAMDFMTVNLADLPWLPRVLPALDALFRLEQGGFEEDADNAVDGAEATAAAGGGGGGAAGAAPAAAVAAPFAANVK